MDSEKIYRILKEKKIDGSYFYQKNEQGKINAF